MNDKLVLQPGPDHPITVDQSAAHVVVTRGDRTIADTRAAYVLREAGYPPAYYVPRDDVDMSVLTPSDHTTYCPYKGDASYFSITGAGEPADDAVWSYEQPYDAVADIGGHLAFYPGQAEVNEIDP